MLYQGQAHMDITEMSGAGTPPEANWIPLRAPDSHCCSSTVERRVLSSHGMQYCPRKVDSLTDEAAGSKQTKASYIRSSQAAGTTTSGIPGRLSLLCVCMSLCMCAHRGLNFSLLAIHLLSLSASELNEQRRQWPTCLAAETKLNKELMSSIRFLRA